MLLIERTGPDGTLVKTWLERRDDGVALISEGRTWPLPSEALARVMERYGKPLDDEVSVPDSWLEFADGSRLATLRYLPRFEVIAKDYLVWQAPGKEPLAELATHISAALEHLARRVAEAASDGASNSAAVSRDP